MCIVLKNVENCVQGCPCARTRGRTHIGLQRIGLWIYHSAQHNLCSMSEVRVCYGYVGRLATLLLLTSAMLCPAGTSGSVQRVCFPHVRSSSTSYNPPYNSHTLCAHCSWQRGRCRFGSNCKFRHDGPQVRGRTQASACDHEGDKTWLHQGWASNHHVQAPAPAPGRAEGTLTAGCSSWRHTEPTRLGSTSAQLATSYLYFWHGCVCCRTSRKYALTATNASGGIGVGLHTGES
jgi:hypothetical protein